MQPGEPVELDVEIWPTCIVIPPGYRLCLSVRGKDYEHEGPPLALEGVKYTLTGVGPFLHEHPQDRPPDVFGGTYTLHFARGKAALPPAAGDSLEGAQSRLHYFADDGVIASRCRPARSPLPIFRCRS